MPSRREYPRHLRVSELLREIVADELERIDDDRLQRMAVTHVDVDPDFRRAIVLVDTLRGEEDDAEVLSALAEHRVRLQAAIGRQARLRRTPTLEFRPDVAIRRGERIEAVLREHPVREHDEEPEAEV